MYSYYLTAKRKACQRISGRYYPPQRGKHDLHTRVLSSDRLTADYRIHMKPFDEDETAEYVSETLHRDREYVLPLTAVIQEKVN